MWILQLEMFFLVNSGSIDLTIQGVWQSTTLCGVCGFGNRSQSVGWDTRLCQLRQLCNSTMIILNGLIFLLQFLPFLRGFPCVSCVRSLPFFNSLYFACLSIQIAKKEFSDGPDNTPCTPMVVHVRHNTTGLHLSKDLGQEVISDD